MFSLNILNVLFSPLPADVIFFLVLKTTQDKIKNTKTPQTFIWPWCNSAYFFSSFYCYKFKDKTPFSQCTVTSSSALDSCCSLSSSPCHSHRSLTGNPGFLIARLSGFFSALILLDFCMAFDTVDYPSL